MPLIGARYMPFGLAVSLIATAAVLAASVFLGFAAMQTESKIATEA